MADRSPWTILSTAFSFLTAAGVGVLIWRAEYAAQQAEVRENRTNDKIDLLTQEVRDKRVALLVDSSELAGHCKANNFEASCTYTNLKPKPATTCVIPTVTSRITPDKKILAAPLCIGPIQPFETRTMSVPWVGNVDDICNSPGYGGREVLDWSKCTFTAEPVPKSAG